MVEAPDINGAEQVVAWFGYWPTFHDAEVLSINMDRRSGCRVEIHAFRKTNSVDDRGCYVCEKNAVITFVLEGFPLDLSGIVNSRIEFFNYQNVLNGLAVNKTSIGYELIMHCIFGVDGVLLGSNITVELTPSTPDDGDGVLRKEYLL